MTWLEGAIGRDYPFGSMGVQLAPPGATGAVLEGQTLVLAGAGLLDPRVDACAWQGLLVHETAHQWFGDSVSLVRWDQKWLSEGHATWYQRLWGGRVGVRPARPRRPDGRQRTPPRAGCPRRGRSSDEPRGPAFAYDATIYDQGALALDALRCEVGDETFRAIEGAWLDRYRDASASTDDFIDVATDVAGRDLLPVPRVMAALRHRAAVPMCSGRVALASRWAAPAEWRRYPAGRGRHGVSGSRGVTRWPTVARTG